MKPYPFFLCLCLGCCNIQPGQDRSEAAQGAGSTERAAPAPPRVSEASPAARPRPPRRGIKTLPVTPRPPVPSGAAGAPWPSPSGGIERIALGDLDQDSRPEVILASHQGVWVTTGAGRVLGQAAAHGHPNALLYPGAAEPGRFYVAWGYGRHYRSGPSRVVAYRYAQGHLGSQTVLVKESQRPAVSGLAYGTWKGQRGLMVGAFADKYHVDLLFATAQGATWRQEPVARVRMANAFVLAPVRKKGTDDLVIGRLYGDDRGKTGDAFVLEASGQRVPIAVRGGLRALAAADLDGDGLTELALGDGWAQAYRKDGRALVTRAAYRGNAFASEVIGTLEGEFMVQKIVVADLDGDRRPELLVLGNDTLGVFKRSATGQWVGRRLSGGAPIDFAVGDTDGDGKQDVLLVTTQEIRRVKNPAPP